MAIWIVLYVGYVAIILIAIEEIRIDRRLKKLGKELMGLKSESKGVASSVKRESIDKVDTTLANFSPGIDKIRLNRDFRLINKRKGRNRGLMETLCQGKVTYI